MNNKTHDGLPPLPPADGEIAQMRYWNISAMKDYARAAVESAAAPQPAQAALSDDKAMEIAWQFQAGGGDGKFTFLAADIPHMFRAILAAIHQPAPVQPADVAPVAAVPLEWTSGPNEFKDWCTQYFGPDSDETYLAEAVFKLPPMAQRFARPVQPPQAQQVAEAVPVDDEASFEKWYAFGGGKLLERNFHAEVCNAARAAWKASRADLTTHPTAQAAPASQVLDEALSKQAKQSLEKIRQAVEVNDGDSLSMWTPDSEIIWAASGSWSGSVIITLGDLRALAHKPASGEA